MKCPTKMQKCTTAFLGLMACLRAKKLLIKQYKIFGFMVRMISSVENRNSEYEEFSVLFDYIEFSHTFLEQMM